MHHLLRCHSRRVHRARVVCTHHTPTIQPTSHPPQPNPPPPPPSPPLPGPPQIMLEHLYDYDEAFAERVRQMYYRVEPYLRKGLQASYP